MGEVEVKKRMSPVERAEEERRNRSNTDKLLLKYARLSGQEIAEKTGLDPVDALQRLNVLLASRDHLTERMEERLLLIELSDFVAEARERQKNASDEDYALIAGVTLRGMREIANRLDARRRLDDKDITEISAGQGSMFMETIRLALDMAGEFVVQRHPEVKNLREDLLEGFQYALPRAREEIMKHVHE